jgi:hypothetical protein
LPWPSLWGLTCLLRLDLLFARLALLLLARLRRLGLRVSAMPEKKYKWPVVTYPQDGSVRDY